MQYRTPEKDKPKLVLKDVEKMGEHRSMSLWKSGRRKLKGGGKKAVFSANSARGEEHGVTKGTEIDKKKTDSEEKSRAEQCKMRGGGKKCVSAMS